MQPPDAFAKSPAAASPAVPPAGQPLAVAEGRRFRGTIKSFNEGAGFGFISCPETRELWQRDVFIHRRDLGGVAAQAGAAVTFSVELNRDGKPQAKLASMDAVGAAAVPAPGAAVVGGAAARPQPAGFCAGAPPPPPGGAVVPCPQEEDSQLHLEEEQEMELLLQLQTQVRSGLPQPPQPQAAAGQLQAGPPPQQQPAGAGQPPQEAQRPQQCPPLIDQQDLLQLLQVSQAQMQQLPPGLHPERRFCGVVRAFDDARGVGLVSCDELRAAFGCDAFLHNSQRRNNEDVGDVITFRVQLSRLGQPRAKDIQALGSMKDTGGRADADPMLPAQRTPAILQSLPPPPPPGPPPGAPAAELAAAGHAPPGALQQALGAPPPPPGGVAAPLAPPPLSAPGAPVLGSGFGAGAGPGPLHGMAVFVAPGPAQLQLLVPGAVHHARPLLGVMPRGLADGMGLQFAPVQAPPGAREGLGVPYAQQLPPRPPVTQFG